MGALNVVADLHALVGHEFLAFRSGHSFVVILGHSFDYGLPLEVGAVFRFEVCTLLHIEQRVRVGLGHHGRRHQLFSEREFSAGVASPLSLILRGSYFHLNLIRV